MSYRGPDGDLYPDELTYKILAFDEEAQSLPVDDVGSLPKMVKEADNQTLLGVYWHLDDIKKDCERLGYEEAPFDLNDHNLIRMVRAELVSRGVSVPKAPQGSQAKVLKFNK